MRDCNGVLIKAGDTLIHLNFPNQPVEVYEIDGELYGGCIKISTYHSSNLKVINND